MTVYAFIPARAGSERIPGKNLERVGDRSLVELAVMCGAFSADRVVVSTNSDTVEAAALKPDIREVDGITEIVSIHHRPDDLCGPHSQIEDAIGHWMRRADPVLADSDVIVLLQPTSPFRRISTVRACVDLCARYDSALTVTLDARRSGRLRSHVSGELKAIWNAPPNFRPRSQEGGPGRHEVVENGCVYAFTARHFRDTKCRMGGREAIVPIGWLEAFEIDTAEDLECARALARVQ